MGLLSDYIGVNFIKCIFFWGGGVKGRSSDDVMMDLQFDDITTSQPTHLKTVERDICDVL